MPISNGSKEYANLEWVEWFNHRRLIETIGNIPPAAAEEEHYAMIEQRLMVAWLKLTAAGKPRAIQLLVASDGILDDGEVRRANRERSPVGEVHRPLPCSSDFQTDDLILSDDRRAMNSQKL